MSPPVAVVKSSALGEMVPLLWSMLPLCTADNGTSAPENGTIAVVNVASLYC